MSRLTGRRELVAALCVIAAACGGSSSTPTTSTPISITNTFSGTLTQNGAWSYSFAVAAAGTVTATLTALDSDSPPKVGLSLGTWNGTACQIIIANDGALVGSQVTGSVSTSGTLCVRVYDALGDIAAPVTFQVTVAHP
jgi:hypothetical protein